MNYFEYAVLLLFVLAWLDIVWLIWKERIRATVVPASASQPTDENAMLRERILDRFRNVTLSHITLEPFSAVEASIPVGSTKIGGLPDLPPAMEWPKDDQGRSLGFLAQLDLHELSVFDVEGVLPASGHLLFFYDARQECWGIEPEDHDKFRVVFLEKNSSDLRRTAFPQDMPTEARYTGCAVKVKVGRSLPGWEHDLVRGRMTKQEEDMFMEMAHEVFGGVQVLGHSSNLQAPMELQCELVTNDLYSVDALGYDEQRAKDLALNANDWRLLLQLDSVEHAGMRWGDVGTIYFWVKKQDLRDRRFERAWFIVQW